MAEKEKGKLKAFMGRLKVFLTKDIWSFDLSQKGPLRRALGNTVKVIVIAIRTFIDDKVMTRAAALTYSTLFAIVPILALIFAVARGFGFGNIFDMVKDSGMIDIEKIEGLDSVMKFIDGYMQYVSSGAFVGIGLLFLLFTVYSLADGIVGFHVWMIDHVETKVEQILVFAGVAREERTNVQLQFVKHLLVHIAVAVNKVTEELILLNRRQM